MGYGEKTMRDEWQFEYQAGTLLDAAETEHQKREARIDYWREKRAEILERLKEQGLEITDWGEGETKLSVGRTRIDVQFDEKLTARLRECQEWLKKAHDEKQEFAMWIQAFSECPETQGFKLHAPDVSYFGLGKSFEADFVAPEDAENSETPSVA